MTLVLLSAAGWPFQAAIFSAFNVGANAILNAAGVGISVSDPLRGRFEAAVSCAPVAWALID
jgi:hypothetical protein